MNIYIITLFPELIQQATEFGVLGRAIRQRQINLHCINPRDYAEDKHRTVDDRPYGGGPGMLMKVEPLLKAILAAKEAAKQSVKVIYLSPQGQPLKQDKFVSAAAGNQDFIFIAGRYEGIDERIIESLVDEEWSIGDYVLSGGEYAALVAIDGMTRLLPGVLGDDESALQDSFMQGLLDCPHYTRPEKISSEISNEISSEHGSEYIKQRDVPDVLLSGDHKSIQRWRLKQALGRTWLRRPDLIEAAKKNATNWDDEKASLLAEFKKEYK